ncbi:MAG: hypothetical protein H8E12_11135 [Rhodobacteraceae bacterium]|nr:hypothetical protein [Paracoccaceae bacterium]
MNKLLLLLLCMPFVGFGQNALDFPSFDFNKVEYVGCQEIFSNTPNEVNFSIYEDSTIHLNQFDERLNISLKFNWLYEENSSNNLGVVSIDLLKNGKLIQKMDFQQILETEAFWDKNSSSDRYGEIVRDDIYLRDLNMDSYLDFQITYTCGGACYFSHWLYNPSKKIFELNEELNNLRQYNISCEEMMIYSYEGGTASTMWFSAYKIDDEKINFHQSLFINHLSDYKIETYTDFNKHQFKIDTLYY